MCYGCSFRAFQPDGYAIRDAYSNLYVVQYSISQHRTLEMFYRGEGIATPASVCSEITLKSTRQLLANEEHQEWFKELSKQHQQQFMERFVWLLVFVFATAKDESIPELEILQDTYKACVLEMLNEMVSWVTQYPLNFKDKELVIISDYPIRNIDVSFKEPKINTPEELRGALVCYFLMDIIKSHCSDELFSHIAKNAFLDTFFDQSGHSEVYSITLEAIHHYRPDMFDTIMMDKSSCLWKMSRDYPVDLTTYPELTKKTESYRRFVTKCEEEVTDVIGKDLSRYVVLKYITV